jgi:hypothetical protein
MLKEINIASLSIISILYFACFIIFTMGIFTETTVALPCYNIDTTYNNNQTKINIDALNYVKVHDDKMPEKIISGISFDTINLGYLKFCMGLFWFLVIVGLFFIGKLFKNKIKIITFAVLFLFYLPFFVIITYRLFNIETLKVTCPLIDLNITKTVDGVKLVNIIADEDTTKTKTLDIIPFASSELLYIKMFMVILWIIIIPIILLFIK